jgi:RNA polymerase sigma-70 factor (ECF subfamily)
MRDDLLARFRAGDHSAVRDLYSTYGAAVYTVAMSILRSRELAADATQQTFVKAWRNASTFDPDREFGPWIYAIARNTSLDLLRAESRRESLSASGDVDLVALSPGIETAWEAFEVRLAIDRLPEEERSVVKLTHLEGHTHSQAAAKLGIAVGTVKSRSHRAHQRLAVLLRHVVEE